DNATNRVVIDEMLRGAGASVSLCDGAAEACEELRRTHRNGFDYHVILLDARMPPYAGIELALEFDPADPERTIVMLASDAFPGGRGVGREAGLVSHLLKPIKRAELLNAAESVAAKTQAVAGKHAAEVGLPRAERAENLRALRLLLAEDSEDNRLLME